MESDMFPKVSYRIRWVSLGPATAAIENKYASRRMTLSHLALVDST